MSELIDMRSFSKRVYDSMSLSVISLSPVSPLLVLLRSDADEMRYGRSRLPELLIISVFGIGGGFYVFQPTFRQLQQQRTGTTATEPAATTSKGT
uniref:Uncharacterized protein n=1 Tax=Anopheles merus TaxID=30066 RepID=A0A182V842_ANOME